MNLFFNSKILKNACSVRSLAFLVVFLLNGIEVFSQSENVFKWEEKFPSSSLNVGTKELELGGTFNGLIGDDLYIMGGSNFPEKPFWDGGGKSWYPNIYRISLNSESKTSWVKVDLKLPKALANGYAFTTSYGIVLTGGAKGTDVSDETWLLKKESGKEVLQKMPAMPFPLVLHSGTQIGNKIFVFGGTQSLTNIEGSRELISLDLDAFYKDENLKWERHTSLPGPGRLLPVMVAQNDGSGNQLFIASGQEPRTGFLNNYLLDAYKYFPKEKEWKKLQDIRFSNEKEAHPLFGGIAVAKGSSDVFVFGGVTGDYNLKLEDLSLQKASTDEPSILDSLTQLQNEIYNTHPGFSKNIVRYNTVTDTWTVVGTLPFQTKITTQAISYKNKVLLPMGEISPGVRSSQLFEGTLVLQEKPFSILNYIVLALYSLLLIAVGRYFYKKQNSTEDYFKAGNRIPWWAAAISLFGTSLSAITFMAVPAKTFSSNWAYLVLSLVVILIPFIVNNLFIPFYKKLNITSAYEYLELRFNLLTRLIGSFSFIVFQLGRVGVILYLPAIAINVTTGIDIYFCILLMGIVSVIYTMMGGIEAVIWTDVLQVIIMMGGALMCLGLLFSKTNGVEELIKIGQSNEKFEIFNMAFDIKQPTFWIVFIGGFFTHLITFSTDQTMVQRYLSTKNVAEAKKSLWLNVLVSIPAIFLFFILGTALYLFYKQNPTLLQPGFQSFDSIFPWYIINELPNGVSGLLIAGIFSAAMSSLSSSMNSAATAISIDFIPLMTKKETSLKNARWITLVFGLLGSGFAILLASTGVKSLWDVFIQIIGLITGGLGGIFLLGIISTRANGVGAVVGLIGSGIIQYFVAKNGMVHLLLYSAIGFISCMVIAYITSVLLHEKDKDLTGLTIFT